LVKGGSVTRIYQDDKPFGPLSLNSRVPVYNDSEKEVNNERKHRYQQHFIVEAHIIRPPSGLPQRANITAITRKQNGPRPHYLDHSSGND
jgi:hypothetical protein